MFVPRSTYSHLLSSSRTSSLARLTPITLNGVSSFRTFFSADNDQDDSQEEQQPHYYTGRVHSYDRQKCFGHITVMDHLGRNDRQFPDRVFVHRSGLVTAPKHLDPADFPQSPYLKQSETVRFTIGMDAQGRPQAENVTYQNGKPVPPLRPTWWLGRQRILHEQCFAPIAQVLENSSDNENDISDDDKVAAFDQARAQYRQMKQEAVDFAAKVGMTLDDFPTELKHAQRGKRSHHNNNPESSTGSSSSSSSSESSTSTTREPEESVVSS